MKKGQKITGLKDKDSEDQIDWIGLLINTESIFNLKWIKDDFLFLLLI